jgi:hypothetical protein
MKYSNSILVVGNGDWAKKIHSSLDNSEYFNAVAQVGARELLNMDSLPILGSEASQITWIATTPEFQIEILDKFSDQTGKFILEKPIGINKEDFARLNQILHKVINPPIFSNPWSKTTIWHEVKKIILKENSTFTGSIRRSGPTRRKYISPFEDWSPHDIYLLLEIDLDLRPSHPIFKALDLLEIQINIGQGGKVSFISGYSIERTALWELRFDNGKELSANFVTNSLIINDEAHCFTDTNTFSNLREPILAVALDAITGGGAMEVQRYIDVLERINTLTHNRITLVKSYG